MAQMSDKSITHLETRKKPESLQGSPSSRPAGMGLGPEGRWAALVLPAGACDRVGLGQNTGPPAMSLKSTHVQRSAATLTWGTWTQLPKGLAKLCGIFNLSHKQLDRKCVRRKRNPDGAVWSLARHCHVTQPSGTGRRPGEHWRAASEPAVLGPGRCGAVTGGCWPHSLCCSRCLSVRETNPRDTLTPRGCTWH